jgi:hypothetical protein
MYPVQCVNHQSGCTPPGKDPGVSPKATEGVWKAGRLSRKLAVKFVQIDLS